MNNLLPFLIAAGIFLFIVLIGYVIVESSRCPACKTAFAVKNLGKLEVGRKKGYRTVTREERDNKGHVVHRWDEQVRVLTVDYLHNHVCSNCGHAWTSKSSEEFDDFDDE